MARASGEQGSNARRAAGERWHAIAVDWSGALAGERRKLWVAEARGGRLVALAAGRTRAELCAQLCARAQRDAPLVVGIDFAFSFPRWFVARQRCGSARELWDRVAREGERWLAACEPPFWGRPGAPRPPERRDRPSWRDTESDCARVRGIAPKAVFQIGGAGSVGTGSLRGMPYLAQLEDAGFSIWPFDVAPAARAPLALEIYPRFLTGPVNKSSRVARALYLQARWPKERPEFLRAAEQSEDAFDAAVSALCMSAAAHEFDELPPARSATELLEGRIWRPRTDPGFTPMH